MADCRAGLAVLAADRRRDSAMASGTVTWFDARIGIGGIAMDGADHELTVYASDVDGGGSVSLRSRDRVHFDVARSPHGLHATHVWVP